jgi:hypothetical protein
MRCAERRVYTERSRSEVNSEGEDQPPQNMFHINGQSTRLKNFMEKAPNNKAPEKNSRALKND